jgi:hypothetical protein
MLQEIGNIVVIGLKARADRWTRCLEIFKREGVTNVTHYQTEADFKDLHRHCSKDFIKLLKYKGKVKNLVFFEDDFELVDGWKSVLQKAWQDVPKDFDLLYLGANLTEKPKRITDNVMQVRGAWCMHAVVLSNKFINYILNSYDVNRVWCVDEWIRQQADIRKFYMTYPMIAYQREGFSDLVGRYVKYEIFENKYYKEYEDCCNGTRLPTATERGR